MPDRGSLYSTALQPALLDPVYQVLLVRVIPVVHDEGLEAGGGLRLDPVLEDESEDATGHLQQEKDGQEDGVGRQERGVLPECPDTPGEAWATAQAGGGQSLVLPMMKVMAPAQMKINAGSRAMFVSWDRLLKVSFSVQAQIPIARIPSPSN